MQGTPCCNFPHLSANSAGRRQSAPLGNFGNDSVDCSKETAVTRRQMRETMGSPPPSLLRYEQMEMSEHDSSTTVDPFQPFPSDNEANLLWTSVNRSRKSASFELTLPERSSSARLNCSNNTKPSGSLARHCRCCHGTLRASFRDIRSYLGLSQDQLPQGLMGGLGDYRCINHYTDMLVKTLRLRRSLI